MGRLDISDTPRSPRQVRDSQPHRARFLTIFVVVASTVIRSRKVKSVTAWFVVKAPPEAYIRKKRQPRPLGLQQEQPGTAHSFSQPPPYNPHKSPRANQ